MTRYGIALLLALVADTPQGVGRVEESRDGQAWALVGYIPQGAAGIQFRAMVQGEPGFVRIIFPQPACVTPDQRSDQ